MKTELVIATIQRRIAARTLVPGAKLPSIRACAAALSVSKSTVVEAYERLAADGAIASRPGSGFYVAARADSLGAAPLDVAELGPKLDREVDPFWISRQSLETDAKTLKPGCGWLPTAWMPGEAIRRALRSIARSPTNDATLLEYGSPRGHAPLRHLVAQRCSNIGVEVAPDQVILTESGTQSLDLMCRFFLEPGDTVLVDDPCYFNFLTLLRAHRARIVSVPYSPNGPDVEAFAATVAAHRPRLWLTNSGLHNPTGASLAPAVAHRVLKIAEDAGMTIVEDDVFADLEWTPAPRLAAFDGLARVVTVGSFSKTLSASVRCGFIVAKPAWIEPLVDLKIAIAFGDSPLSAGIVHALLKDGTYRRHVETVRRRLLRAMSHVTTRLRGLGLEPAFEPRAGMFLWCKLPDGLDAADVARRALARNVVLAPGNAFSLAQSAGAYLRFNVAQSTDARVFQVLAKVMAGG